MDTEHTPNQELPTIETTLDAAEVVAKLKARSKRGKLAGFDEHPRSGIASVTAYGTPFDGILTLHHQNNTISFEATLARKLPTIFAIALILTVWPGLPLTDSFLHNFIWYERVVAWGLETWMWYVPTTILPLPFVWRTAIKRSRSSMRTHALETIEKLRPLLSAAS